MTIRQYNMMGEFMRKNHSIHNALRFEQRTFGSLCKHRWIDYDANVQEFYLTNEGATEFKFFNAVDRLYRTNAKRPLSMYAPKRAVKVVNIKHAA